MGNKKNPKKTKSGHGRPQKRMKNEKLRRCNVGLKRRVEMNSEKISS